MSVFWGNTLDLMDLPEIHKDTQNRGGEKEIHINSGREEEGREDRRGGEG